MTDWIKILKNYGYPKRPCDTKCTDGCPARPDCSLFRQWQNQIEIDAKEKRKRLKILDKGIKKRGMNMAGKKLSHSQLGEEKKKRFLIKYKDLCERYDMIIIEVYGDEPPWVFTKEEINAEINANLKRGNNFEDVLAKQIKHLRED